MKKTILSAVVFTLFLTSAFTVFGQSEVSVYSQPDSPLQLSNVVPSWRKSNDFKGQEVNMLSIEFISQNIGDKSIRAYTIRQFSGDFDSDIGATIFSYAPTDSGLLKPNQLRHENIGESGSSVTPEKIKIAVDFVAFTDGSTWGKDASKSAQQLAGVRGGGAAALEYLKGINKQDGIEAVIKTLDEMKELLPPVDKSEIWKRGFRSGISNIKNHIKRAYENEGIKGAETELQKPFDTFSSKY